MKLKDVERKSGVKYSTLRDLVKKEGYDELNMEVGNVFKIATMLGVSVEELYNRTAPSLTNDEAVLVKNYRKLSEEGQGVASAAVLGFVVCGQYKKHNSDRLVQEQA